MNPIKEKALEQLINKTVKSQTEIKKILVRDFPIDEDLAAIIASDATNQAIGLHDIKRYSRIQRTKAVKAFITNSNMWRMIGRTFGILIVGAILLSIIFGMGSCVYSCATAPSPPVYPRTYEAIKETTRFTDKNIRDSYGNVKEGEKSVAGLNDFNQRCVLRQGFGYGDDIKKPELCIHTNKLNSLNNALDYAVANDFNGVVWSEPNGNGEVWQVERNYYRFVITGFKDENYK